MTPKTIQIDGMSYDLLPSGAVYPGDRLAYEAFRRELDVLSTRIEALLVARDAWKQSSEEQEEMAAKAFHERDEALAKAAAWEKARDYERERTARTLDDMAALSDELDRWYIKYDKLRSKYKALKRMVGKR